MPELNEIIHQPTRLRIMSALSVLERKERMDFRTLRDLLNLTDGNLGAHIGKLHESGYLRVDKEFIEQKPRTYLSLTASGRSAFEQHVQALKEILER